MKYKKFKLDNGLSVVLCPTKQFKTVTALLAIKIGSRNETEDESGISHFLEHMLLNGTKKYPSKLELARLLDSIGAQYNAFTSKEATVFYAKANYKKIDIILSYLADIVTNSLLDKKSISIEKDVVKEEINMYLDNVSLYVDFLFDQLFFKKHSLGRDIGGTIETVNKINQKKLIKHWHKYYQPQNMVLTICGNMNINKTINTIKQKYKKIGPQQLSKNKKNLKLENNDLKVNEIVSPFVYTDKKYKLNVKYKKIKQVNMLMGFSGIPYLVKESYAITLLAKILGGSSSSKLFTKLRGKHGLCYSIQANSVAYQDCGYFYISAGLNTKNLSKAINLIAKELKSLKNKKITTQELKAAQDCVIGNILINHENTYTFAANYSQQELFKNKIMTLEEMLAKVRAVTVNDIQNLAKKIFKKELLNLVLVGEKKQKEVKEILDKINFNMNIGIDCSALFDDNGHVKGGIGYYILNLILYQINNNQGIDYYLFFNKYIKNNIFEKENYNNVHIKYCPYYKYRKFLPFVYRNFFKSKYYKKFDLDLMHFPANTAPLFYDKPYVLTIHDLAIYENKNWFNYSPIHTKIILPNSIKKAKKIFAVSNNTKDDITKYFKVDKSNIVVTYLGYSNHKVLNNNYLIKENQADDKGINEIIKQPFLLFIGTIEPRKNIVNTVKAFNYIKNANKHDYSNLKLVLCGNKGWKSKTIFKEIKNSDYKKDIYIFNNVINRQKEELLDNAKILLYPSWYEGFGLPILEGFKHNLPVITSDFGATKEIAQNAAYLVEPSNYKLIANGINKILNIPTLKKELIIKGQERLKDFSWQKSVETVVKVYKELG